MTIFWEQKIFYRFRQKSFFWGSKRNFGSHFFVEKWLNPIKLEIKLRKVKKFGIGWCIPQRMAADKTEEGGKGGSGQTLLGLIGLTSERI